MTDVKYCLSCCDESQALGEMDLSTKLPADPASGRPAAQLVIGTLDLNVGAKLPAEELVGRFPEEEEASKRAYLSNVCVARSARRRGVAQALMLHAEQEAIKAGVRHLYVHVVHDNGPAVQLYRQTLGFGLESEESAAFARTLERPRRLLLAKTLD